MACEEMKSLIIHVANIKLQIKAVKEMLESFEKQILDSMQQPHENKMNPQLHSINLQGSVAALDSTAQTGHANGGDWQEEVYQKVI